MPIIFKPHIATQTAFYTFHQVICHNLQKCRIEAHRDHTEGDGEICFFIVGASVYDIRPPDKDRGDIPARLLPIVYKYVKVI